MVRDYTDEQLSAFIKHDESQWMRRPTFYRAIMLESLGRGRRPRRNPKRKSRKKTKANPTSKRARKYGKERERHKLTEGQIWGQGGWGAIPIDIDRWPNARLSYAIARSNSMWIYYASAQYNRDYIVEVHNPIGSSEWYVGAYERRPWFKFWRNPDSAPAPYIMRGSDGSRKTLQRRFDKLIYDLANFGPDKDLAAIGTAHQRVKPIRRKRPLANPSSKKKAKKNPNGPSDLGAYKRSAHNMSDRVIKTNFNKLKISHDPTDRKKAEILNTEMGVRLSVLRHTNPAKLTPEDKKKMKAAAKIGRHNATIAADQLGEYGNSLEDAWGAYRQNVDDTIGETIKGGSTRDIHQAGSNAFDAEFKRLTGYDAWAA